MCLRCVDSGVLMYVGVVGGVEWMALDVCHVSFHLNYTLRCEPKDRGRSNTYLKLMKLDRGNVYLGKNIISVQIY